MHQEVGKNEEFFKYLCINEKMPDYEMDPDSPIIGRPIKLE